ncbi:HesA/MoeB/ThiF family protein [Litoreibacter roseus]|uniref:Molybdopterin-synthase adenylyltransferase n=1 Tax=Litoreibacter roseus TaxID=2601869 RepID=A0A6N6JB11_9RHOB|nr:HesA/MoeB/ThiF family protein [Litoreibacter roseus]GFE63326.1 molybdopterin biosynthesis protein [Litoreibacter roseus]
MLLILAIAAGIYFGGRQLGVAHHVRTSLLIVLFVAVLFFQLTLADGNPLKDATGGSVANWLIAAGVAAIFVAYRTLLQRLRTRHLEEMPEAESDSDNFKPAELDRYARHIILREVGGAGQRKLKNARVLVVGAGGLGAPALQYLAAAGVGTIGIIDDDIVESSNLQRQVIHTDARIGMPKAFSAVEALKAQNPFVAIKPYNRRLTADIAEDLISEYDLVLDGTDNFATRYLVNQICVALSRPLISAAITQWEGQISLYNADPNAPCYACVFPAEPADGLAPTCAEAGVMGALPGVIGSMMAVEAIKWITQAGDPLNGRMMIYDALYSETRVIAVRKSLTCMVCAKSQ